MEKVRIPLKKISVQHKQENFFHSSHKIQPLKNAEWQRSGNKQYHLQKQSYDYHQLLFIPS